MSKYMSELNAATNLQTAGMSAAASRDVAGINASASRHASDVHLQAQQYATDQNNATRTALQEAQQKFQDYLKDAYPSNVWSTAVSVGRSLGEKLRPEW